MQKVLEANHQNAHMHLLISHRKSLSPDQWCVLVSDFEQGKLSIELEMSIKLEYTQRLPYKLAVLGLADVSCARRKMMEIVRRIFNRLTASPVRNQKKYYGGVGMVFFPDSKLMETFHVISGTCQFSPLIKRGIGLRMLT
jgi:hypothetical protein